ncbi:MAG: DUF6325 family protein [Streptosporangiaceae bacterium]
MLSATRGAVMPWTIDPASIGPVDVAVIGFADHAFRPELAAALRELVDTRTVRIIDLAFVVKAADGTTAAAEIPDSEVAAAFSGLDDEQNDLLSDEDLLEIAERLEPATAALVIVWENSWAAKFAQAVRQADGVLVSQEPIPHATVVRAIEALNSE